jgi:hypothetical protein
MVRWVEPYGILPQVMLSSLMTVCDIDFLQSLYCTSVLDIESKNPEKTFKVYVQALSSVVNAVSKLSI